MQPPISKHLLALALFGFFTASASHLASTSAQGATKTLAADDDSCNYMLVGKKVTRDDPRVEAEVLSLGEPGKPGGVDHTPPRNQEQGELCWAYAGCGLAEGRAIANGQPATHTSPEFEQFWNIYHQFTGRMAYFKRLQAELKGKPKDARDARIQEEIRNVYQVTAKRRAARSTKAAASHLFEVTTGNVESQAFRDFGRAGMVPVEVFDAPIASALKEANFEAAMRNFTGQVMLKGDMSRYDATDGDGVNTELYNDLTRYLSTYLGEKKPLRPHDTFTYRDQSYTPLTFMKDYLGFDPKDYEPHEATLETHELALEAIAQSIEAGYAVPIGIDLFGDSVTAEKLDLQSFAQETGVFTPTFCAGGVCKEAEGGHEILSVNFLFQKGRGGKRRKVTALIIKNSWNNNMGRTVDGKIPGADHRAGYYVVTAEYLRQNITQSDPYDFVLPKAIADLPEFKGKFKVEK